MPDASQRGAGQAPSRLLALTTAGTKLRDQIAVAVGESALVMERLNDAERRRLEKLLARMLEDPTHG